MRNEISLSHACDSKHDDKVGLVTEQCKHFIIDKVITKKAQNVQTMLSRGLRHKEQSRLKFSYGVLD